MKKDWKFPLGRTLVTRSVDKCMRDSSDFYCFVMESLYSKYVHGDWGNTCKEDKKVNDDAVKNGERILAVYRDPNTKKKKKKQSGS